MLNSNAINLIIEKITNKPADPEFRFLVEYKGAAIFGQVFGRFVNFSSYAAPGTEVTSDFISAAQAAAGYNPQGYGFPGEIKCRCDKNGFVIAEWYCYSSSD